MKPFRAFFHPGSHHPRGAPEPGAARAGALGGPEEGAAGGAKCKPTCAKQGEGELLNWIALPSSYNTGIRPDIQL